jgi:hypothetical protein
MDIFKVVDIARSHLDETDIVFHERVCTMLGLFRAKGILAVNRTQVNGDLHYLFSATIVAAYYLNTKIYVSSRMYGKYVENNVSTKFIKWLDASVKAKLLMSSSPKGLAEGYLELSSTIRDYIEDVVEVPKDVEHWNSTELTA